jgi:hypothetical protein
MKMAEEENLFLDGTLLANARLRSSIALSALAAGKVALRPGTLYQL